MSAEDVAQKILRHLRKNQGVRVTWKELANITKARPELVKDAVSVLTRDCHPITVAGAGCTYANSKVRRNAARKEAAVGDTTKEHPPVTAAGKSLLSELALLRESLFAQAGVVETIIERVKQGDLAVPARRDAAAEGAALKAIRLERGASVAAMAGWIGKSTIALEALERGEAVLSDAEIEAAARELRMDASVLTSRLRGETREAQE